MDDKQGRAAPAPLAEPRRPWCSIHNMHPDACFDVHHENHKRWLEQINEREQEELHEHD